MKITVNLATRPFADLGPTLKRLRIAMAVFAVVCHRPRRRDCTCCTPRPKRPAPAMHALDNQIAKINQERQGYQAMMRQPDNAQVLQQANNLNALFDQKAFSWTLAMEDLETVLPGGVQVTTLEPVRDEKTGQITLKLRVVGPRDKGIELVQNLEHSRHFLHPAIAGESLENSGGPGTALEPVSASNRVNFDLNADYNPATVGEHPARHQAGKNDKSESDSDSTATERAQQGVRAPAVPDLRRPFTGVSNRRRRPARRMPRPSGAAPPRRVPASLPGAGASQPAPNAQQKPTPVATSSRSTREVRNERKTQDHLPRTARFSAHLACRPVSPCC